MLFHTTWDALILIANILGFFWLEKTDCLFFVHNPKFGGCCAYEKVFLPHLQDLPHRLQYFYEGDDSQCKKFWQNIWMYCATHSFTFIGVSTSFTQINGVGLYIFKFQGELKHLSRSLLSSKQKPIVYSQFHIIDTQKTRLRMLRNHECLQPTMFEL